jgi:hypothetical protein
MFLRVLFLNFDNHALFVFVLLDRWTATHWNWNSPPFNPLDWIIHRTTLALKSSYCSKVGHNQFFTICGCHCVQAKDQYALFWKQTGIFWSEYNTLAIDSLHFYLFRPGEVSDQFTVALFERKWCQMFQFNFLCVNCWTVGFGPTFSWFRIGSIGL